MKKKIGAVTIDCRDEGQGIPLILLHAFPLNQRMWDPQVSGLSSLCRVITLDLRGFGGSETVDGPSLMDEMASDVRGLMSSLSIDRAVVGGLSMGGYVALAFYRKYPDLVQGLILADTRAEADGLEGRERREKSAEKVERDGVSAIAEEMLPNAMSPATLAAHPETGRLMLEIAGENQSRGVAAAQRGMARRQDSSDLLAGIRCPVLLIFGRDDRFSPPEVGEQMHKEIPGSSLVIIDEAGHLSNMEKPAEFNSAVAGFLGKLKR